MKPPTPTEIIEAGQGVMLRVIEAAPSHPAHVLDQAEAANSESMHAMEIMELLLTTRGGSSRSGNPNQKDVAKTLALISYAIAASDSRCEHALLQSPRPLIISLGRGLFTCMSCLSSRPSTPDKFPGACDWCHEQTSDFYPYVVRLGYVTLHSDACASCTADLKGHFVP